MTSKTALATIKEDEYRCKLRDVNIDPLAENVAEQITSKWKELLAAEQTRKSEVPPNPDLDKMAELMKIVVPRSASEELKRMEIDLEIGIRTTRDGGGIRIIALNNDDPEVDLAKIRGLLEKLDFKSDGTETRAKTGIIQGGNLNNARYIEIPKLTTEEAHHFAAIFEMPTSSAKAFVEGVEKAREKSGIHLK